MVCEDCTGCRYRKECVERQPLRVESATAKLARIKERNDNKYGLATGKLKWALEEFEKNSSAVVRGE